MRWWQWGCADAEAVRGFFRRSRGAQLALWGVSVVATSMLIGDGVLTPSISGEGGGCVCMHVIVVLYVIVVVRVLGQAAWNGLGRVGLRPLLRSRVW